MKCLTSRARDRASATLLAAFVFAGCTQRPRGGATGAAAAPGHAQPTPSPSPPPAPLPPPPPPPPPAPLVCAVLPTLAGQRMLYAQVVDADTGQALDADRVAELTVVLRRTDNQTLIGRASRAGACFASSVGGAGHVFVGAQAECWSYNDAECDLARDGTPTQPVRIELTHRDPQHYLEANGRCALRPIAQVPLIARGDFLRVIVDDAAAMPGQMTAALRRASEQSGVSYDALVVASAQRVAGEACHGAGCLQGPGTSDLPAEIRDRVVTITPAQARRVDRELSGLRWRPDALTPRASMAATPQGRMAAPP